MQGSLLAGPRITVGKNIKSEIKERTICNASIEQHKEGNKSSVAVQYRVSLSILLHEVLGFVSRDCSRNSPLHYLQPSPQLAVISRSSESESQFQVLFRHPSCDRRYCTAREK